MQHKMIRNVIVIDSKSIYSIISIGNATNSKILESYLLNRTKEEQSVTAKRGIGRLNQLYAMKRKLQSYEYQIKKLSDTLYIVLEIKRRPSSLVQVRRKFKSTMVIDGKPNRTTITATIEGFDIVYWWANVYPIIEQISNVTGAIIGTSAIGTAAYHFVKWFRNKVQGLGGRDESAFIKEILSKNNWRTSDLAEKLNVSKEDAKKMLQGFGFKWNPIKQKYVESDLTDKMRKERLKKRK